MDPILALFSRTEKRTASGGLSEGRSFCKTDWRSEMNSNSQFRFKTGWPVCANPHSGPTPIRLDLGAIVGGPQADIRVGFPVACAAGTSLRGGQP